MDILHLNKGDFSVYDGALLSFYSNDPKYSFLKLDRDGLVTETIEKQVISNYAICGAYYFKNKQLFLDMTKQYLDECNYTEYFVSGVYNVMAKHNKKIRNFVVDSHISFGTPEEYEQALHSKELEELK